MALVDTEKKQEEKKGTHYVRLNNEELKDVWRYLTETEIEEAPKKGRGAATDVIKKFLLKLVETVSAKKLEKIMGNGQAETEETE